MIRQVSNKNEQLKYRVFCDKCGRGSSCTHEDPGDLAIKAKKEKFVTVPGKFSFDPMTWSCHGCANLQG